MFVRNTQVTTARLLRLAACALLLPCCAPLAAAQPLSLQEATVRALEQAPLLEAREGAVTAATEEAARAGALPDPMLMLGIENLPVTGSKAFDFGADDMTMKRVGLRQEIPAPAKRAARRELAARQVDAARASSETERLAVQRGTAQAWIALWTAEHEVEALQSLHEQAALAAKLAKARAGAGGGTLVDALAAKAAVLELDNEIEQARSDRAAASAALSRWLPGAEVDMAAGDPDFSALPVAAARLRASIDQLAPLLQARAEVETAAAEVSLARAEKRPDWSVSAYYGQRAGERSDMLGIEVGIALPWLNRNRTDRGVSAREADYRSALALREDGERQLTAALDAALARWQSLQRQVALHRDALLPLAHDRSVAALAAYRAGGELQPWLEARSAELELHRAHARHLGEYGQAWAELAYLMPSESQP